MPTTLYGEQIAWNSARNMRDMQTLLFVSVTHGTLSVQLFVSANAVERIYASCARYANLVVRFSHTWNPISSVVRFYRCCGTHICFVCEICKPCCSFPSRMEPYQFSCSFLQLLWNAYMLHVRDMQTLLFVSVMHGTLSVQLFVSAAHETQSNVRFCHAWNPSSCSFLLNALVRSPYEDAHRCMESNMHEIT